MGFGSVWLAARFPLHVGNIKERRDSCRHEQRPPRIDEIQEKVPSLDQTPATGSVTSITLYDRPVAEHAVGELVLHLPGEKRTS